MACNPPWTQRWLSYNRRLNPRDFSTIELVVVHATELPDMAMAREYAERIHYPESGTGNSGHFYIDRNGSIEQWVALDRVAHHVTGHNAESVGIELVNRGRYPDWYDSRHQTWPEPASEAQITALIDLLNQLTNTLPALKIIAGHDQLDQREVPASDNPNIKVQRKLDPGPDFPWQRILSSTRLRRLESLSENDS